MKEMGSDVSFEEFAKSLTDEQRELLRAEHAKVEWLCVAHDEGQHCCIDAILDGVELP